MSDSIEKKKIEPEPIVNELDPTACQSCGATDWGVASVTADQNFYKCDKCHHWDGFQLRRNQGMDLQ